LPAHWSRSTLPGLRSTPTIRGALALAAARDTHPVAGGETLYGEPVRPFFEAAPFDVAIVNVPSNGYAEDAAHRPDGRGL